ncbi:hypothetical protein J3E71DRAFT_187046, partial [Bipolaris maydis]
ISMCIRVVEKFPVCGCTYHVHSVDQCASYGLHPVEDKTIWVGASCHQYGAQKKCEKYHGSAQALPNNYISR